MQLESLPSFRCLCFINKMLFCFEVLFFSEPNYKKKFFVVVVLSLGVFELH